MDNHRTGKSLVKSLGSLYQSTYSCYMDYRLLIYFVEEIVPITFIYEMTKIKDELIQILRQTQNLEPKLFESAHSDLIELSISISEAQKTLLNLYQEKIDRLMDGLKTPTQSEKELDGKFMHENRKIHETFFRNYPHVLPELLSPEQPFTLEKKNKALHYEKQDFWRDYLPKKNRHEQERLV